MHRSRMEAFHLIRASVWVLLAPIALLTSLKNSVPFVILLSLYANFAGDISAWQASRADRRIKDQGES